MRLWSDDGASNFVARGEGGARVTAVRGVAASFVNEAFVYEDGMAKTLYVIDGHYQIYRAFFGLPSRLTGPGGEPTGATHLFCMMLVGLIRSRRPDYLAMALDVSDETVFRRDIDPEYKAHRDPAPEGLHIQADRIISIVSAMGIPILRVPGFEADDLMATVAERMRGEDVDVYLVSRDKDLDQVLSDRVRLFDPVKQEVVDPESLFAAKGFRPEQAVEIQTLVGDSTDNIPGVSGVGPKTAAKLIQQYGTADAVVAHADEQTPKLAERLKEFAVQLPRTRQLVTLRRDVPFEFQLEACAVSRFTPSRARPIFDELNFTTVVTAFQGLSDLVGAGASPGALTTEQTMPVAPRVSAVADPSTYRLVDSPKKLDELAAILRNQAVVAFDTETTGTQPVQARLVGVSVAWGEGQAAYVPVLGINGDLLGEAQVRATLGPIFADPSIAKVGHNLKFDLLVLRQIGIEVRGANFDSMIASFLLDPMRRSHGLKGLTNELLGYEMTPLSDLIGKGRTEITMDQVATRRACEYAAADADFTFRLCELLAKQMAESPFATLFRETEMPLVDVLAEMENNGVALDSALLKKLSAEFGDRLQDLTKEVHRTAGHTFNVDSPKQLATVLFEELGFQPVRKTKTGQSTDADTLEALAEQGGNPLPRLVLEYRELSKLKGTYVDTLPTMVCRRTGRIHTSFSQIGAITGRLSSSDPNLQNIPIRTETGRRIRAAFVACDADHLLLSADYSQIELRLLAHFCGDEALRDAFSRGQDIHRAVAAQVNGVALEEVTSTQRSAAKAVNFGIIYGQSAFGLARSLGIPQGDAKAFIDMYFLRYPGIRVFIDRCVREARRLGYVETILGRRRPIPELQSRNRTEVSLGERLAINTIVQGSAADLIKRAMIAIHQEVQAKRLAARMLLQVHDELLFEVPARDIEVVGGNVRAFMEGAMTLDVPITVDLSSGHSWAEKG